jgi:hypothetical protein
MEAVNTPETSYYYHDTTRCNIPEEFNLDFEFLIQRIWKDTAVAYFNKQPTHSPGDTEPIR